MFKVPDITYVATWNDERKGYDVRRLAVPEENTYKAIGGRHFAKAAIPQLKFDDRHDGLTVIVEVDNAMVTDDVAAVSLNIVFNGANWHVNGSAKRDPSDRPNHEIGMALATARAVKKFSDQLTRQANGKVKHADWIELDHELRRQDSTAAKWVGPKKGKKKRKTKKKGETLVTVVDG